jgi:hypothetical protein
MAVRDGILVFLHKYVSTVSLGAAASARPASAWPDGGPPDDAELRTRLKTAKKALELVTAGDKDHVFLDD